MAKILITGTSKGIGYTTALILARAGHQVIATMRNPSACDLEQFRRVMETNYIGAVRCVKQVLPSMRKRGSGCIVNITSIAGRVAFGGASACNASKFALEGFTECLAQEVKGHGIRVALVEPGIIDTSMATTNLPQYDENSIYPHGKRIHAFFTDGCKPAAILANRQERSKDDD